MVTVFRASGLRVVIFVNDHLPAHVLVFGDGEAKINLNGADGTPELIWADEMIRSEVRCALRTVMSKKCCCWLGGRTSMVEVTDAQVDAALDRGKAARLNEPRAMTARYESQIGRVIVELTNGCTFAFPPHLVQGLEAATATQLAEVAILGAGHGLHWEALDADLSVSGLLVGLFGTKAHMARHAGQAKSPAKAAAARANGAKGGRPRKSSIG